MVESGYENCVPTGASTGGQVLRHAPVHADLSGVSRSKTYTVLPELSVRRPSPLALRNVRPSARANPLTSVTSIRYLIVFIGNSYFKSVPALPIRGGMLYGNAW